MQRGGKLIIALIAAAGVIGLLVHFTQKPAGGTSPQHSSNSTPRTIASKSSLHREDGSETNITEGDDDSDSLHPTPEKTEEYLRLHHHNAASLLAAFEVLNDTNYLIQAATNFPNDPRVQLAVLERNVFPEDRRKWLDAFKASSPSNSLANYLSAADYFKQNQPADAIKELQAASGKNQFGDYTVESFLNAEDLARFNGDSEAGVSMVGIEAAFANSSGELLNLKAIASSIGDAEKQYMNSGDSESLENIATLGLQMSDRLDSGDGGKFLINQMVGSASEMVVLKSLDQNTAYDFLDGETPSQRIAELQQQRTAVWGLLGIANTIPQDGPEMVTYSERMMIYGEAAALQWYQSEHPETPPQPPKWAPPQ